jgi:hypothetical protein
MINFAYPHLDIAYVLTSDECDLTIWPFLTGVHFLDSLTLTREENVT